jgi:hypothetical protein
MNLIRSNDNLCVHPSNDNIIPPLAGFFLQGMVFVLLLKQYAAMRQIFISWILFSAIAFTSCDKDDTDTGSNNFHPETLIDKKWQIQSNISIDSMNRETDLFSGQEAYTKDDYLIFAADSTYQLNDNIILQSDTASKIIDSGTWLFSADNSHLLRHSDMYERDYEPALIKALTANSFMTETYFASDKSTIRTSYISVP